MKTKLLLLVWALLGLNLAKSNEPSFTTINDNCDDIPLMMNTQNFSVLQDAYLTNGQGFNNSQVVVEDGASEGFLEFDLGTLSGTVSLIELQLTITEAGSGTVNIFKGLSNWSEDNLSNTDRPIQDQYLGGMSGDYNIGDVIRKPLNQAHITDGKLSLIFVQKSGGTGFAFASKENSTIVSAEIFVTYENGTDPSENPYGTYQLINSITDQPVRSLGSVNNLTLQEAIDMNISATAPTDSDVKSISFIFNGIKRVENDVPYAMFQEDDGDYNNGSLLAGLTEVTVSYYSDFDEGGSLVARDVIALNVGVVGSEGDYYPRQDAHLYNGQRRNQPTITIEKDVSVAYLQFDLGNVVGTITGLELQLTIDGDEGNGTTNIFLGSHSDWTEGDLTEATKPSQGAFLGNFSGNHDIGDKKRADLDLEDISGGKITLILVQRNGDDGFAFASAEDAVPSKRPILTVSIDGDDGRDDSGDIHTVHDAHISGEEVKNENTIAIQKDVSVGYLQFDLDGLSGAVTFAELWFTISDAGSGTTNIFTGSHSDWTETSLTPSDAPRQRSYLGSISGSHSEGEIKKVQLDASDLNDFLGDQLTIILNQKNGDAFAIASEENSDYDIKPILILTIESEEPVTQLVFVFDTAGNQIMRKEPESTNSAKSSPEGKNAEPISENQKSAVDDDNLIVTYEPYDILGEEDNFANGVVLYPNPTAGKLTMLWQAKYNDTILSIVVNDISGKRIQVDWSEGNDARVDLTSYAPGMYFVTFNMKDGSSIHKKVIKK